MWHHLIVGKVVGQISLDGCIPEELRLSKLEGPLGIVGSPLPVGEDLDSPHLAGEAVGSPVVGDRLVDMPPEHLLSLLWPRPSYFHTRAVQSECSSDEPVDGVSR